MELLFVLVIAAAIGLAIRYLLPQRTTYGLLIALQPTEQPALPDREGPPEDGPPEEGPPVEAEPDG